MKGIWPSRSSRVRNEAPGESASAAPVAGAGGLDARLRDALIDSRQRYKDLVEISSDFVWETRADGSFAFVSPRGALGYPAHALVDRLVGGFMAGRPGGGAANPFMARSRIEEVEIGFRRADGTVAILEAAARPLFDEEGIWRGARGLCRDVTEARRREAALELARQRERLFAKIVAAIRDVVEPTDMLTVAAESIAGAFGDASCRIFRYTPRGFVLAASAGKEEATIDLRGLLTGVLDASGDAVAEVDGLFLAPSRYRHAVNGALCLWRADVGKIWDEEERRLATAIANQLGIAIEQIANHEALERLSHTDPLTGLLNRRGFFEELGRRLPRFERGPRPASLVCVDLDNFKPVNDRFGHQRGDALLRKVAALLRRDTRPTDAVARLGGDEFALWLEGADEIAARTRAELLLRSAMELKEFSAAETKPLGFSIGIASVNHRAGEGLETLIARADAAMYAAKRSGKGGFHVAGPSKGAETA